MTLPPIIHTSEPGSWAHETFSSRVPRIIDDVIAANDFSHEIVDAMNRLRAEIVGGKIRALEEMADNRAFWDAHTNEHIGKSWLAVPWFWAEAFFYRRVLEATRYFQPGQFYHHDPYTNIKRTELARALQTLHAVLESLPADKHTAFNILLHADLWGNRVDLSMYNIANHRQSVSSFEHERANLLVDDTARVWQSLTYPLPPSLRGSGNIQFVCDNAGTELLFDLALADLLLRAEIAGEIILHLKPQPTFVSDAMPKDALESIDALGQSSTPMLRQLAGRLAQAIDSGQLVLSEHPFWVTGFFFHNLPDGLRATLAQSSLVISKGDANYRRLIGDCHWESTASFASAVEHFPAPVVAVRTLKSEPVVGLRRGLADKLRTQDPAWSINGRYGVSQFSER